VVRGNRVLHVEHVWTTAVIIDIPHTGGRIWAALAAVAECTEFFNGVDQVFSTFRPDSLATRYRNGLTRPSDLTAEFREVIDGCRVARAASAGAFDPWAMPGGFDPLGYVKGWAAGRASALIKAAGFPDHLVDAGGDVVAAGDQELPGSGWRVGVLNPHDRASVVQVARLRDTAMATSGHYERGQHVIDPSTGRPATGTDSATVVGPDPGLADALASAALVSGRDTANWFGGLGPDWSLLLVQGQQVLTLGAAFPIPPSGTHP
jgi:thiamine biosynthesis lipoprotein